MSALTADAKALGRNEVILMTDGFPRLIAKRKCGTEPLHSRGRPLGPTLLDFWCWSASDLVSNATRGRLAEFIVAHALGARVDGVRDEWDAVDLITPAGRRVEVKSAAYVQSWHQKKLSLISFRTPMTRAWSADTNEVAQEARRQAEVYVLALLAARDKPRVDPLDVSQWRFYAVATRVLNERTRSQYSITLPSLEHLGIRAVEYPELAAVVEAALCS